MFKSLVAALAIGMSFFAISCGENDSDTIPVTQFNGVVHAAGGRAASATISGNKVVNGQIANGVGDVFQSSMSNATGNFNFSTLDYSGPIHFSTDTTPSLTATLASTPVNVNTPLALTPFSSVVTQVATNAGGLSTANINAAKASVQTWLGNAFDVYTTIPVDPATNANADQASQAQKFYQILIGGLARMANDLNKTNAEIMTDLINDASDGMLDGMMGANPITDIGPTGFTMTLAACTSAYLTNESNLTVDMNAFNTFTT
ncbi:MAG: hypothetical protein KDB07_04685, partial [Planctomycetes bacterium]|nr:hypothetical protein [Planctomycetota bacterium]